MGKVIICSKLEESVAQTDSEVNFFEFSKTGGLVHALYVSPRAYDLKQKLGAPDNAIMNLETHIKVINQELGEIRDFQIPQLYACFFNTISEDNLKIYPAELIDTEAVCPTRGDCFAANVDGLGRYLLDLQHRVNSPSKQLPPKMGEPKKQKYVPPRNVTYDTFKGANMYEFLANRYVLPMMNALEPPRDDKSFNRIKGAFWKFCQGSPAEKDFPDITWMVEHNYDDEYAKAIDYYLSSICDIRTAIKKDTPEGYLDAAKLRDELKTFVTGLQGLSHS